MTNIKTLALRRAAVTVLADEFEASGTPYTCAAVVFNYALPMAATFATGTGWTPARLALRVADEVSARGTIGAKA
jgi:hypothetical protein